MADNSLTPLGDTIASDDVTTLNGSASSGVKVERAKVVFGSPKASTDVDATHPLPVTPVGTATVIGDSLIVTGTGNALNATPLAATDAKNYRWVSVQLVGDASVSGVVATFEVSNDNTNWNTGALLTAGGTQTAPQQTVAVAASASVTLQGPVTARYFRVRLSSWTAGTVTATALFYAQPSGLMTVGAALGTSTAEIGFVQTVGRWQDETSTVLAAGATYTGTTWDLLQTPSGGAFANAASAAKEIRAIAVSDQAGTLALEISRDNATFRRIQEVTATTGNTGGLFVAQLQYLPATRYCRFVYVNGATLQTHFMLQHVRLA